MPRRVAVSTLNASTLDILNVIRQNASYDYQQNVPKITKATDIPKVGEVICGTPAFANQFINALVNRIALVRVKSATFNNPYARLKKGYLAYGETVEDIFVNIAKVVEYTPEKGPEREHKRTLPDVKSAFHVMNWRVMYQVTIQDEDLQLAFLSVDGVENLIAKIVDSVYTAAEYDEFLLFKYLLIKAISHGKMYPVSIGDGTKFSDSAVQFRGISNMLTFMKSEYNERNVKTTTPRDRQSIFLDSMFEAKFDVDVLANAFNMDRATYLGKRELIDDWTTFDNDRFEVIRANSDNIEEVTTAELELMKDVVGVIIDDEWFQVFDNNNKFTEKYVASGLYWNYFYHVWKTISSSPFANAVVFVKNTAGIATPESVTVEILGKDTSAEATVFTLGVQDDNASLANGYYSFVQTASATSDGIAIHPYGAVIFPTGKTTTTLELTYGGVKYTTETALTTATNVGDTINFTKG